MSAPVRRPRRPEGPRPATADPYANRPMLQVDTPPNQSPNASPVKTASRPTASSHIKAKSVHTTRPGTSGSDKSSTAASPRISPAKSRTRINQHAESPSTSAKESSIDGSALSPNSKEDNFTMIIPNGRHADRSQLHPSRSRQDLGRPGSGHSPLASTAEEENFTLVIPPRQTTTIPPATNGSPTRPGTSGSFETEAEPSLQARTENEQPLAIYEDPDAQRTEQPQRAEIVEPVLEEIPVNEQFNHPPSRDNTAGTNGHDRDHEEEERPISPSKRILVQPGEVSQDRAETLKNRRLLASGIDRIRAKTLDPHGFRRLQEFVKSSAKETSAPLGELLDALCSYVESPDQTLRVNASKAQSLKSQCLATIRGLVTLHRQDDKVRPLIGRVLCAALATYRSTDNGSQIANDIEKTTNLLVRAAGDQLTDCINAVLQLAEDEASSEYQNRSHVASMSLGVLSRLLQQAQSRPEELGTTQKARLGKLAVRFLEDMDADVRRADTEFCTDLYGVFGESDKEGFWEVLKGAREAQLNLVAYYLARRGRAAR